VHQRLSGKIPNALKELTQEIASGTFQRGISVATSPASQCARCIRRSLIPFVAFECNQGFDLDGPLPFFGTTKPKTAETQ
jgi:hypothetical protein